jgi:hypothetical protein
MAVKNAAAQKLNLAELGSKALKGNAIDEAFDEIIAEDPEMHDLYVKLLSEALERVRTSGSKKPPRGSC